MLAVEGVTKAFEGVLALDEVSLEVAAHSITALVGPNGAGKTTLFNIVAGSYPPTRGTVRLEGRVLDGVPAHERVRLGIGRTFQNALLFDHMTVLENVMVGRHVHGRAGMVAAALRLPRMRAEEERLYLDGMKYLNLVGLGQRAQMLAGSLPFGQQRLVAIARALATEPRLLLMDEPAAGLNALEKLDLADLIRRIQEMGITVLLIEHDVPLVMRLAERIIVLDHGRKLAEGTPEQVRRDRKVLAAYLGEGAA
jgi:branched-chain amino acid transport system ATP-binding protein